MGPWSRMWSTAVVPVSGHSKGAGGADFASGFAATVSPQARARTAARSSRMVGMVWRMGPSVSSVEAGTLW